MELEKRREKKYFVAHLSGENEVPPVRSRTTGKFEAKTCYCHELKYRLTLKKINGLTQAHIHLGREDENGPVVAFLYTSSGIPGSLEQNPSGKITYFVRDGCITEDDLVGPLMGRSLLDLIREMEDGNTYINVHTIQNIPGEVRGQIRRDHKDCDRCHDKVKVEVIEKEEEKQHEEEVEEKKD